MTLRLNCNPLSAYRNCTPDIVEKLTQQLHIAEGSRGFDWDAGNLFGSMEWCETPQGATFWARVHEGHIYRAFRELVS